MDVQYLNEKKTSAMIGVGLSTLRNNRSLGVGLPYIKFGKSVRYKKTDIERFAEEHKITPKEV